MAARTDDVLLAVDPPPTGQERPLVWQLLFAFMFMFQGYGALVGNPQSALKHSLGIHHGDPKSEVYQTGTQMLQIGKAGMRILSLFFVIAFYPRQLVHISYLLMFVSMLIPPIAVFWAGSEWLGFVFLTSGVGGIAMGIFEGTFLSVISPLGRNTKLFVIMGAPLGFAMLNIVGGTLQGLGMPPVVYYIYTAACVPVGALIFHRFGPVDAEIHGKGWHVFARSIKAGREWLPMMVPWFLAKFVGNFVLENLFPVTYSMFDAAYVPIFSPSSTSPKIPTAFYMADYFWILNALGDTVSRRVPHYLTISPRRKAYALLFLAICMSVCGEGLLLLITPIITGIGAFVAQSGNGFIYGLSAKFIDEFVAAEHNYASYMLWCFFGDMGGTLGASVVVDKIVTWVCTGRDFEYVCHHR